MEDQGKNYVIGCGYRRIHLSSTEKRRFWRKVVRTRGCWRWVGGRGKHYGVWTILRGARRVQFRAHAIAFNLFVGPVPKDLVLDHKCQITLCCNPGHLKPVTRKVNCLLGGSPPAMNARKTECKRGHIDWYTKPNGERACRECGRRAMVAYRKRRKRKSTGSMPGHPLHPPR